MIDKLVQVKARWVLWNRRGMCCCCSRVCFHNVLTEELLQLFVIEGRKVQTHFVRKVLDSTVDNVHLLGQRIGIFHERVQVLAV